VCEEGKVKADIRAQIIKVEGAVEGDLHADRSVFVAESGNLRGNIHAPSVSLVEGSHFNGTINMDMKKGDAEPKKGAPQGSKSNNRGQ
jgi:cytoskeletal protein CcmA (bactofilin family)